MVKGQRMINFYQKQTSWTAVWVTTKQQKRFCKPELYLLQYTSIINYRISKIFNWERE